MSIERIILNREERSYEVPSVTWNASFSLPGLTTATSAVYSLAASSTSAIAVINSGNKIARTTDGSTWSLITLPVTGVWRGVFHKNGVWILTRSDAANCLRSTDDGITWTTQTIPAARVLSVLSGFDNCWLASGSGTTSCIYSHDQGLTWTTANFPSSVTVINFCETSNGILAVGGNAVVFRSTDNGVTWTTTTSVPTNTYSVISAESGNGIIVALRATPTNLFYFSYDNGVNWNVGTFPSSRTYRHVRFCNGFFVFVGNAYDTTMPGAVSYDARTLGFNQMNPTSGYYYTLATSIGSKLIALAPYYNRTLCTV